MENEKYLWLVMKSLTGEISPEEKEELDKMLKESRHDYEKHVLLKKFWNQEVFYNHSADTNEALEKILAKIDPDGEEEGETKTRIFSLRNLKRLAIAAVLLVAIGLGIFSFQFISDNGNTIGMIEKYNGSGTRSMITLPDGTRIWLNSDSKISYPEVFKERTRNVYLTGEAFFKVAHDPSKPFYIHMNKARIKVLGTSFNVKAYQNEDIIQAAVVNGKVAFMTEIESRNKPNTVFLTKNNKITYSKNSGEIKTEITDTNDDKEWINGKLIFKSETLESICRQLERNFGKKILFRGDKLKQHRFTGSFEESSLNEIIYYLSLSKPFKYSASDSTLTIY